MGATWWRHSLGGQDVDVGARGASSTPGNVAIRGIKVHCYQAMAKHPLVGRNTSIWLESHGWVGSLLYLGSQAEYCDGCKKINSEAPNSAQARACKCYEVVQTGGGAF